MNFFKKKSHSSKPIKKNVQPVETLIDGELPFGWIAHHREFISDIEVKQHHFMDEWISAKPETKEKYQTLKSFIIFLYEAKSICQAKGECYEKWFTDIIADETYFQKREKELEELEEKLKG